MKNSKKVLACTLGLMLGVGILAGCGAKPEYTVTFKEVTETLHTEVVKEGDLCPEYVPEVREGYLFMGWYTSRTTKDETTKFDFNTPITSDLTLYAWYKAEWKASSAAFFVVGSFAGAAWDGNASEVPADRAFTHTVDEENQKNIYEYTINRIERNETFRLIRALDGVTPDGWTSYYGFDLITKVTDANGADLNKDEYFYLDNGISNDNNIGSNIPSKIKVTYIMESDHSQHGEINIQVLETYEVSAPETVGLVGSMCNWGNDGSTDIDLTSEDEGATWTITYEFAAGDIWKIRPNDGWSADWGYGDIVSQPEGAFTHGVDVAEDGTETPNSNIVCVVAGTYKVDFDFFNGTIAIEAVDAEDEAKPIVSYDFSTLTSSSTAETAFANDTVSATYSSTGGKVYFNGTGTGGAHPDANGMIKAGTSKVDGDFTLTYADDVKITKVVIVCHDFYRLSSDHPTNSNTISVNGSEPVLLPYNADGAGEAMTFEIAETNIVSFTFHFRAYIWSITLY